MFDYPECDLKTKEREYFKDIIYREKRKYLAITIGWNITIAAARIFFRQGNYEKLPALLFSAVLTFCTFIGLFLIVDTIRKWFFWRVSDFDFTRAEIINQYVDTRRIKKIFPQYYLHAIFPDKRENSRLAVNSRVYSAQVENIIVAKHHKQTEFTYVFSPETYNYCYTTL